MQFGNAETIRANLRIDSPESGHLSRWPLAYLVSLQELDDSAEIGFGRRLPQQMDLCGSLARCLSDPVPNIAQAKRFM